MIVFVIPAFNEESGVRTVCTAICAQMDAMGESDFRICVVDDGSSDGTAPAVTALSATRREVSLVRHEENLGVPSAFLTGLNWALSLADDDDIVFFMEADCTNDPAIIPRMARKVGPGAEVVIASRMIPGGAYIGFPPLRELCSRLGNRLMRLWFHIPGVSDYTIFYRAYRAGILRAIWDDFKAEPYYGRSFAVNADMLRLLHAHNAVFKEIPHRYSYNLKESRSKMSLFYNILFYAKILLR